MEKTEKWMQYAVAITGCISEMFEEGSDHYIDDDELNEGDNLTHFFHALTNVAPTSIFNGITGEDKTHLEFNHVANQLCFQYARRNKETSDD